MSMSADPVEVILLGEAPVTMIATRRGPLAEASTFERVVAGALPTRAEAERLLATAGPDQLR
jgi:hypothetical protein